MARFPDAPTERGARHLQELTRALSDGYRAAVLFVVQRADADAFGPYDAIDPAFGQALRAARYAGWSFTPGPWTPAPVARRWPVPFPSG